MKLSQIKIEYILLLLVIMLGLALRVYGLDRSLWLDEVTSVYRQRDLQSLTLYIPPNLFFVIIHFFMLFGESEIALRLPSVIFGVLSIFLMYKIGKLLFKRPTEGLVGAFLLSISTMHIQHSQEGRYYSISMFLALLSVFFLYKAINGKDKKLWVGWIFSTFLAILSHWYMVFIVAFEMVFLLFIIVKNRSSIIMGVRKIGKKRILILLLGLVIVAVIPFVVFQRAFSLIESGIGLRVRPYGLKPSLFFQDLLSSFNLGYPTGYLSIFYEEPVFTGFLYLFMFFFLLGIFTGLKKHKEQTVLLLIWVFLPALTVYILTLIIGPIATARYLILILPGYLIAVSRGISTIGNSLLNLYYKIVYRIPSIPLVKRRKWIVSSVTVIIILVLIASVSAVSLQQHYKKPYDFEDWKAATEYLETNSRPDNVIITDPYYLLDPLYYYYERESATSDSMKRITTSPSIPPSLNPLQNFEETVSKHDEVWLVFSRHSGFFTSTVLGWAEDNSIKIESFTNVDIYYYNAELTLISTNDMSFVGLDSPPNQPVAIFWNNNDAATFNISISKPDNYTIALHTRSGWSNDKGWLGTTSLELLSDDTLKGFRTYSAPDWKYVEIGTFFFDPGLHEITVICRQGPDFGNTGVQFDKVAIWPMG